MSNIQVDRFFALYEEFMPYIETKTPEYLLYHNAFHTKQVIHNVMEIGRHEAIDDAELELIKIAALFHDIGFLYQRENHEAKGCQFVRDNLSNRGFSLNEVEAICGMIMATKIPQKPRNKWEAILADADLEYLGTDEFQNGSHRLFQELRYFDQSLNKMKWLDIQIDFISQHSYHTSFCQREKEPVKQEHLRFLKVQKDNQI